MEPDAPLNRKFCGTHECRLERERSRDRKDDEARRKITRQGANWALLSKRACLYCRKPLTDGRRPGERLNTKATLHPECAVAYQNNIRSVARIADRQPRPCANERCKEMIAADEPLSRMYHSRVCYSQDAAWRRRQNPEYRAIATARTREYNYQLTQEQYDVLLAAQGGHCGLCPATEAGGKGGWHVDHDHACCPGKRSCGECTRGLLCHRCNMLLGHAEDSVERLEAAIGYLREPPAKRLWPEGPIAYLERGTIDINGSS